MDSKASTIYDILSNLSNACLKHNTYENVQESVLSCQFLECIKANEVNCEMTHHFRILADRLISGGHIKTVKESAYYHAAISALITQVNLSKKLAPPDKTKTSSETVDAL